MAAVSFPLATVQVFTSKVPITATDLLHDRAPPLYEALGIAVRAVLTFNGRDVGGRPVSHLHQMLLAMEAVEPTHSRPAARAQTSSSSG